MPLAFGLRYYIYVLLFTLIIFNIKCLRLELVATFLKDCDKKLL
uniref:Uncharacterized protein n=1 Tax=Rhizophora mucronata TaxID=61149 RepID=A0A2P2QFR5_RHIMU